MMRIFDYFRAGKKSASIAKERLQIIVAHERAQTGGHEYLPVLQEELLQVIRKYVNVDRDAIRIELERDGDMEVLELNITLPETVVRTTAGR